MKNIILPDTLACSLPKQKTEKGKMQEKNRESKKNILEVIKKSNANVLKIRLREIFYSLTE